jgi:lysophospholipid acyltransferase (LPLAT)-like uncharacterized protein
MSSVLVYSGNERVASDCLWIPMRRHVTRVLLVLTIWFIGITTRKTRINWNVLETLARAGQPAILCVWHNTIMYFIYALAPLGLTVMISRSKDGDDITWVANRFGFRAARGSPAEGGSIALREMLRVLADGRPVVITPDGPQGPRYELKAGVVALARHKKLPIIPIVYSAPARWEFKSWDRMKLPKPFSRAVIWVGDPMDVSQEEDAVAHARVQETMRRLTRQAEAFTGADQRFPDTALADDRPATA